MSRAICQVGLFAGVIFFVGLMGCGQSTISVDPELLADQRARLTLVDEPDGAQVVPEVRNALLGISDEHIDHDADHDQGEHTDHDHEGEHAEDEGHDHDQHADHDHEEGDGEGDGDRDEFGDEEEDEEDRDAHEEHGARDRQEAEHHDEHADHDHEQSDHEEHAEHEHVAEHGEEHAEHDGQEHEVAIVKATDPMDVVLVGQIGGLTNPWQETQPDFPFARNQAAFFLADPQAVTENAESGHSHADGEECAFCAAHAADRSTMLAMVRFLDEEGRVLRIGVRQLFDVEEQDTVVVRGTARVIEGGMMVVDATGLYVRR